MLVSAIMPNQIENYHSLYNDKSDSRFKIYDAETGETTLDDETYENIRHWKNFCEEQISKNLDIIA